MNMSMWMMIPKTLSIHSVFNPPRRTFRQVPYMEIPYMDSLGPAQPICGETTSEWKTSNGKELISTIIVWRTAMLLMKARGGCGGRSN